MMKKMTKLVALALVAFLVLPALATAGVGGAKPGVGGADPSQRDVRPVPLDKSLEVPQGDQQLELKGVGGALEGVGGAFKLRKLLPEWLQNLLD